MPTRRIRPRAPWAGAALAGAVFGADTAGAVTEPRLGVDLPLAHWVQQAPWGPLSDLFAATNWGGLSWHPVALAAACGAACLPAVGARALLLLPAALASLLAALVKAWVGRPRPGPGLAHGLQPVHGFSYPSGHATFYAWLAVILCLVLRPRLGPWRPLAYALAAAVVAVACLGRVYVGAHWPSDVVAGAALGAGWAALVAWAWEGAPGGAARRAYLRWKRSPPA